MAKLTEEIIKFFHSQHFVIVSTVDKDGMPHTSCKGIVNIDPKGMIYLLDLYKGKTYENLMKNGSMSISAVAESRAIRGIPRRFCQNRNSLSR